MSPIFKKRLQKFKKTKKAYYSFLIIVITYFISIFAPLYMNNKPLLLKYQGSYFFPIFFFYTENQFGGTQFTEPNYKKLKKTPQFQDSKNWMLFPLFSFGVNEDNLESDEVLSNPPNSPDGKHILGTDDRGRDVFTRLVYGYRLAMTFSIILIILEFLIAIIIGGIQGYFGGMVDLFSQRIIEILSAIPFLYLILIMGSIFGRSFGVLLLTYASLGWIGLSYYIRGEFLATRKLSYVESAKVQGLPTYNIIFKHILPNAISPVITFLPFSLISAITVLNALDFLGYGIPAPNPSWGEMIGQGRERLTAWWLLFYPSLALFLLILLSSFVGEGLRNSFDPKEDIRYE